MSLRAALEYAVRGDEVPAVLLEAAFGEIMDEKVTAVPAAALLVALRTKGESVSEIVAAARALRARARTFRFEHGAATFNISTAAALVVAGAGVPVAKHGNRAASSRSGTIDAFEALGVRADLPMESALEVLRSVGIAPLYARQAHPAMKVLAAVRRELGIRTLMNCLGPLLNPAGVRRQLVGVYESALVEPLAQALHELGAIRALVVHGEDGLDEITVTGRTRAAELRDGRVRPVLIDPESLGIPRAEPEALRGGDAAENAVIVRRVLEGEPGAPRDIVELNAAAGLMVAGVAEDLAEGLESARHSIESGAARGKLEALVRASAEVAA
jgi:anthranilate phosphoribosyltransferase